MQLPTLGISPESISFTSISMESDKRICVQEQVNTFQRNLFFILCLFYFQQNSFLAIQVAVRVRQFSHVPDVSFCFSQSPLPGGKTSGSIAIIDVPAASLRGRFPSGAESAIINPKLPLLALLGTLWVDCTRDRACHCNSPAVSCFFSQ